VAELAALPAKAREAAARALAAAGVRANHLTILGLVLSLASGFLFYLGQMRWAAGVLVLAGLSDLLDGAVARASGGATDFGAFLDSTLDRYSDIAVFGGIALYYASLGADRYVVVTLLALAGSLLTSYARARAECVIERCKVGVFERPERIGVLILAGVAGHLGAGVVILAVAANVTVLQRIAYTKLEISRTKPTEGSGKGGND